MTTDDGILRIPTPKEQEIIAAVARMSDRLRAAKFYPKCVVLNDTAWGSSADHFTYILGLPVVHVESEEWPEVQVAVLAP